MPWFVRCSFYVRDKTCINYHSHNHTLAGFHQLGLLSMHQSGIRTATEVLPLSDVRAVIAAAHIKGPVTPETPNGPVALRRSPGTPVSVNARAEPAPFPQKAAAASAGAVHVP